MNPELSLTLVARLRVGIDTFIEAGEVPAGTRRVIPLAGGIVEGPEIRGTVPALGADWNLVRADGSETVSARYLIRTHDDVVLSVRNDGVITDRRSGRYGVTALSIEAPAGSSYAYLNDAVLVGSLGVEGDDSGVVVVLEYWRADIVEPS